MKMKLLLSLSFSIAYFYGLSQNKLRIETSANLSIPFTGNKTRTYVSQENNYTLYYESNKRRNNPSLNLRVLGESEINKNFRLGLQSGIYIYFNEQHFIGIKRTYVGVPLQLSTSYLIPLKTKNSLAINFAGGIMLHKKIDDFVFQVKNLSYLYNANIAYQFATKHLIRIGLEHQREQASFIFNKVNPTSNEMFKFPLKRNGFTIGYGFKIK
jgi:hypothetical protein